MMFSLFTRMLYDKRWFILGWSIAIGAMVAMVAAFYPSFSKGDVFEELSRSVPEQLQAFMGNAASFRYLPNYVATQLYDIRVPLFMMIMCLVLALSASVGLEEKGLLRGFISLPMSRMRAFLETWLAGVAIIGLICLATALATYVGILSIGEQPPHELLWRLSVLSWLSGIAAYSLPLALGFATGSRAVTLSIGLFSTVGSFIISSFAVAVDWLKDIEFLSLLYYYDTAALLEGRFNMLDITVLSAITLASLTIGVVMFRRRDVS